MREEHLRQCLQEAMWEKELENNNLRKAIVLVQAVFQEGYLVKACTRQTVVPIPNRDGKDFRRIRLVEVL